MSSTAILFAIWSFSVYSIPFQNWTEQSPQPPYPNGWSAIGQYNDEIIYILGGNNNRQQLISYNISSNTFIDHGSTVLPYSLFGLGQYWTQIGNIVYMARDSSIQLFDVSTLQATSNAYTIPIFVSYQSCLTSIIQNNHEFIFIVGGSASLSNAKNVVQILNLTTGSWLSNVPTLTVERSRLTCFADSNYLYAIGGVNEAVGGALSSIEIINITDLSQISTKSWTYIDNLQLTRGGHRSFFYENYLFIVGGASGGYPEDTIVDILNISSNAIINMDTPYLAYGANQPAVIVVGDIGYAFGGHGYLQKWQSVILKVPTNEPTNAPTNEPTHDPTNSPSIEPTMEPTLSPITSYLPTTTPIIIGGNDSDSEVSLTEIIIIILLIIIIILLICFGIFYLKKKRNKKQNDELETENIANINNLELNELNEYQNKHQNDKEGEGDINDTTIEQNTNGDDVDDIFSDDVDKNAESDNIDGDIVQTVDQMTVDTMQFYDE